VSAVVRTILSLCDESGIMVEHYRSAGYRVVQVDLVHGQDVRLLEHHAAHGIIAQPPCTHLAGSGARWWKSKGVAALLEAMAVVDACLRFVATNPDAWWVLENPVGRLSRFLGKPAMTFNPCDFGGYADGGDAYTKRTCLWGRFNKPQPRRVAPTEGSRMHLIAPGPDRQRQRSLTPRGFARAFFEANP
jgi:hypothetical protein